LIVDDEPLARQSVRRLLKRHTDIQILGECGDGASAVKEISEKNPDLVFLDIQMPELDGFGVVERVGVEEMPASIFVTAYDQYALNAFDTNAIDYLLKPFGQDRFERALKRARERLSLPLDRESLHALLEAARQKGPCIENLPVSENGKILFIKTRDIQWIESAGNYARLHLASGHHDVRETLTALESRLDTKQFARIHRSVIVNLHYVKEVHPWFHGYHLVVLESGRKLRMSRYQKNTAARLGLR
jgi:two-component system LytT family response regulator